MNFQVLRGAIFDFVDELEARVLGIGLVLSEGMSRLTETAFDASLNLIEAVIEEGFNLFRVGLVVILGKPDVDFGFVAEEFNYGDFDTDPWANGKTPDIEDDTGDWPSPTSRFPGGEPLKEGN